MEICRILVRTKVRTRHICRLILENVFFVSTAEKTVSKNSKFYLAIETSDAFNKSATRTSFITRTKTITCSKTIAGFPTAISCDRDVVNGVLVPSLVLPDNSRKFFLVIFFPENARRNQKKKIFRQYFFCVSLQILRIFEEHQIEGTVRF